MQTGDILVGRYEVDSLLGRGGMSSVFAGFDRTLGREVAIKVLATELVDDRLFVERFDREARAAASLSHRNIVAVFDSGVDGATRFIVMERVPGTTVSELLRDGPLPVAQAVEVAMLVGQALGAAHVRGIVHRDVKPGNVMVGQHGQVKVLDFGIARALAAASLTRASTVIGTAGYLSPEQAEGGPVDARSDVYGLGCVLYEMLTGRPPFVADAPAALVHQHLTRPPEPPSKLRPEVSAALDEVVLRCLAKDPRERYERAALLCGALTHVPLTRDQAANDPAAHTTRVLSRWRGTHSMRRRLAQWPGPKRRWLAGSAAALLLGALALILALDHGSTGRAPAATTRAAATGSRSGAASDPKRTTSARTSTAKPSGPAGAPTSSTQTPATRAPADASAAAAALSALIGADERQGLIDPKAARAISRHGDALLRAVASGEASGAAQQLAELARKVDTLAAKGDIATAATAEALKVAASGLAGARPSGAPRVGGEAPSPSPGDHARRHGHDGGSEESQD